jgi:hypothetical protein
MIDAKKEKSWYEKQVYNRLAKEDDGKVKSAETFTDDNITNELGSLIFAVHKIKKSYL